jgi:hypothetical protein
VAKVRSSFTPRIEGSDRLYLPVVSAVKISLRGSYMRMAHRSLNRPEIIPVIQKSRGKGVTDNVSRSVLNQERGVNGNGERYFVL